MCFNHRLEIQEDCVLISRLCTLKIHLLGRKKSGKYSRLTFKMSLMMICQILIVFAHFQNRSLILNCSEIPQRARINYSVIQSDISFPHHSKKISNFSILTNFIFRIITWSSNHSNDHGFNSRTIFRNAAFWLARAADKSVIHVTAYTFSNFTNFFLKFHQLFSMDINYVL